jgi:hypothetical protein
MNQRKVSLRMGDPGFLAVANCRSRSPGWPASRASCLLFPSRIIALRIAICQLLEFSRRLR